MSEPGDPLPPTEPLAGRVAIGLAKVGIALRTHAWQEGQLRGLTPTQAQILVVLTDAPAGRIRLAELAGRLGIRASTASEAVTALVRKRLVERARADEDARALALTLTGAGRAEAERLGRWPDFLAQAVDALPEAEQAALLRGLVGIIRALQERRQIPTAAMCVTCRFFRPRVHADPRRPHHCAFVDAPFGDRDLRLDCPDHAAASPEEASRLMATFAATGEETP